MTSKKQRVIQKIIEGNSIDSVRRSESVSSKSIVKWLVEFVQGGRNLENLDKPILRQQHLTAGHIEWVYHVLLHKSPKDMGIERFLWNGHLLQKTIQHWCTKSYPVGRVYSLLKDMGFQFENPTKYKLTSEVVKQYRAAKPAKSQAFYLDFYSLKLGFKVVQGESGGAVIMRKIPVNTNHNVIYAFNLERNETRFITNEGPIDAKSAIRFLEYFSLDFPSPAFLVTPSHSVFSSAEVLEYAKLHFQQINLFPVATQI